MPAQDRSNSTATIIRPYRSAKGTYDIAYFQESTQISTSAIRVGDVVQYDVNVSTANHRVVKASTMANVPNVISTAILGIAGNTPASTVTDTTPGPNPNTDGGNVGVQVFLASKGTEFLFPSKASVVQHVSSVIGTRRAIAYDSTLNIFYLDVANSTAGDATVIVTGLVDPGSSNGQFVGKFISTNVARFVSAAF